MDRNWRVKSFTKLFHFIEIRECNSSLFYLFLALKHFLISSITQSANCFSLLLSFSFISHLFFMCNLYTFYRAEKKSFQCAQEKFLWWWLMNFFNNLLEIGKSYSFYHEKFSIVLMRMRRKQIMENFVMIFCNLGSITINSELLLIRIFSLTKKNKIFSR